MKKKLYAMLMAVVVALTAQVASGAVKEGEYTLSPMIGGYTFSSKQHMETSPVFGIRGGYNLTKNYSLEALFDYVSARGRGSAILDPSNNGTFAHRYGDMGVMRYGGQVLYNFMPDSKLVPHVALGVGGMTVDGAGVKHSQGYFDYGVGLKYFLTEKVALRGDVRHVIYDFYKTYHNLEYTLGAYIPFGGVKPAAKPVEPPPVQEKAQPKAAAPAPAPVVAEPAPAPAPKPVVVPPPPAPKPVPPPAPPVVQSAQKAAPASKFCNPAVLEVTFATNKSDIKPEFHDELKTVGDFLIEYPNAKGEISGHTDNVGGKEMNQKLSQRRAESVKKYIVDKFGVNAARIDAKGYGFSKPIASNKTKEGKAKNRRIEANFSCGDK